MNEYWNSVRNRAKAKFADVEYWHTGDDSVWMEFEDGGNLRIAEHEDSLIVSYWDGNTAVNIDTLSHVKPRKVVSIASVVREMAKTLVKE